MTQNDNDVLWEKLLDNLASASAAIIEFGADMERLKAENARFRKALEDICDDTRSNRWEKTLRKVAEEALEGK